MTYTTIISTDDLAAHVAEPHWAVIDCRFQLKDLGHGRRAYDESHIAGAIYADLNEDLSGAIIPGQTGRHPLPPVEAAARKFSEWGIDDNTQVVAYDDAGGALAAARLWWMLRWLGHEYAAVLDGGIQKWSREGRPLRSGVETRPPAAFTARPRPDMLVDAGTIQSHLGDSSFRLVDVRAQERYRGETEPLDPVAGHIPGAVNAPVAGSLAEDGRFKSQEALRAHFNPILGGHTASQTVFYCGSGVNAAHSILTLMHAGLGEAKLYAGSWSDWVTDPNRPVRTGEEQA